MSIGFLVRATGRARSGVKEALADLLEQNVLVEVSAPSFNATRVLRIQKDYEAWGRYSVDPMDIPAYLRRDWQSRPDQGQHGEQGQQSEQGQRTALNRASRVNAGPQGGPEQGQQGEPFKGRRRARVEKNPRPSAAADEGLDGFWQAYPRKEGEQDARGAWAARRRRTASRPRRRRGRCTPWPASGRRRLSGGACRSRPASSEREAVAGGWEGGRRPAGPLAERRRASGPLTSATGMQDLVHGEWRYSDDDECGGEQRA